MKFRNILLHTIAIVLFISASNTWANNQNNTYKCTQKIREDLKNQTEIFNQLTKKLLEVKEIRHIVKLNKDVMQKNIRLADNNIALSIEQIKFLANEAVNLNDLNIILTDIAETIDLQASSLPSDQIWTYNDFFQVLINEDITNKQNIKIEKIYQYILSKEESSPQETRLLPTQLSEISPSEELQQVINDKINLIEARQIALDRDLTLVIEDKKISKEALLKADKSETIEVDLQKLDKQVISLERKIRAKSNDIGQAPSKEQACFVDNQMEQP